MEYIGKYLYGQLKFLDELFEISTWKCGKNAEKDDMWLFAVYSRCTASCKNAHANNEFSDKSIDREDTTAISQD